MKDGTQKASLVGGLVAGFLASICCIGPVVFAIIGVSGISFIQKFEEYRSVFIGLAALLLGVAFYFTYRKKPAEECEPESFCANPKSDRINKIVLWVATVLIALFIFFPNIVEKLTN
jgi:mercuric ion transport protein